MFIIIIVDTDTFRLSCNYNLKPLNGTIENSYLHHETRKTKYLEIY